MQKRQIWACEPHFGKVGGDARPWLMARWKAHGPLSIRLNWTSFAICYLSVTVRELRRNVYSSAVFTGGRPFHWNFTWTGSSPSIILGMRKLETMDYPMVKTASFYIPSFWHNTVVWRTDRRRDGFAVTLAIWRAVKHDRHALRPPILIISFGIRYSISLLHTKNLFWVWRIVCINTPSRCSYRAGGITRLCARIILHIYN